MTIELSPLSLLNSLSYEQQKDFVEALENSKSKFCQKALFGKTEKQKVQGAADLTMSLILLNALKINKEMPNINF